MRASRTVKKGGILKYERYRWQSDALKNWAGRWVWIVEPAAGTLPNTIRVEDKDGAHLADAERREPIS